MLAGLVPAIALVWARPGYDVVVPWGALALTLVVVPLLAGLGALAADAFSAALWCIA